MSLLRKRNRWSVHLISALAILATAIAVAQETLPAATDPVAAEKAPIIESVEVTARREELRKAADSFVSTVTRADRANIARWRSPICALIAGALPAQADFVKARVGEIATSVGARVDQDPKCEANLLVFLTTEPDELVRGLRGRSTGVFSGASPRELDEFLKSARTVRVWHRLQLQSADGSDAVRSSSQAPEYRMRDSRVVSSVAEGVAAVIVIVDTGRIGNTTLGQLSDYISMVALAQTELDAEVADTPTILRLFSEPPPKTFPAQLTDWDLAFLKAVYGMSDSYLQEKRAIANRMTQDLEQRD